MSPRGVRTSYPPRRRSRRTVWSTLVAPSTVVAAATSANVYMLADLDVAGSSLLGITILRTHLMIATTSVVSSGDAYRWGLVVGRFAEVGNPAPAGALTGASLDISWMMNVQEVASPTFSHDGSNNTVTYDVKSKRRHTQENLAYMLAITNQTGIAKTFNIFARTLIALP